MKSISLVIPVYNEQETIDALFTRCMAAMEKITPHFEIICVDDGSSDATLPRLLHYHGIDRRFKVLSLSRNFGHQSAILAGMSHANGDYIAIIDGDLQDPPEILVDFAAKLDEGYDVVFAVRRKRKEGFIKKSLYWMYYRILKKMSNIEMPLDSGDFSMMRRVVVDYITARPEQSLFIRGMRSWVGFKQTGLEYERDKRMAGEPKYNFRKLLKLAMNGIFSFSHFPVRFLSRLGLTVTVFSVVYILITIVKKFFFGDVPQGFTTLIIFISLYSGVQLLALGLIGEYVIRIYDESRGRPLFIVRDKFLD